jgi:membrane associated rhomboid family serine protease
MRPSRRQSPPFIRRWAAGYPSVTVLLIALCVGAFAAQCIVGWMLAAEPPDSRWILWKYLALDHPSMIEGQYWKLVTYGFLHPEPWPLILAANMLLLYLAGREVEPIVGKTHFIAIFALGNVIGGGADWLAMSAMPETRVVGVAAGVAAVIVAFTTVLPELEVTMLLFFVVPLRIRAKHLAMALVATCGFLCFMLRLESTAVSAAGMLAASMGPAGILAASVFGWAYVKQLGFGNPLPIQRFIFERRQRAARLARMTPEQFMKMEMDPILEKISREGMRSLSRSERKILDQGRSKFIAKQGGITKPASL